MGLIKELTNFANETSIHGVKYISSASSLSRRVIWALLFLGSLIYATVQTMSIVECKFEKLQYFKKSMNVFKQNIKAPSSHLVYIDNKLK